VKSTVPILVLVFTSPLAAVFGQEAGPLQLGRRVRVTHDCPSGASQVADQSTGRCRVHVGTLVTVRGDTLQFTAGRSAVSVFRGSISKLQVQRGRRGHPLAGAATGFAVGSVVAFVVWNSSVGCDRQRSQDASSLLGCIEIAALSGGLPGGLLGLGIGSLIRTDRWEEVPLQRLRAYLIPHARGGVALAFSLAF